VASDQQDVAPVTAVQIDRDTASRLGVTTQAIDDTLYDAFGQRQVSTIFTQLNLHPVILQVSPPAKGDANARDKPYVRSLSCQAIPVSAVARFVPQVAPLAISHQGQFRSVTLSFNVAPGTSLGQAVDAIAQASRSLEVPPGIHASYQGAAQAFAE